MKTWIKGGLIGGIIGFILLGGFFFIYQTFFFTCIGGTECAISPQDKIIQSLISGILGSIIGFISGAIIGLIIQKIKSKQQHAN
tara:strand:+ start:850 stop:1101 length:252 start_codon:yes stop_codon:yes gene_type:complete